MRVKTPLLVLNFLLAAIFAMFAWMQRNDIDPAIYDHPSVIDAALWLVFYLAIGVLFVVVGFRVIPRWLLVIAAVACLVEMVRTGPGLYENVFGEKDFTMTQMSMSAEDPRVELSREFFGAVIALAGVSLIAWENRRSSVTRDS
jgi:glucan phosphoethanolaminetransferase (alkaline phosphatase superfamily)